MRTYGQYCALARALDVIGDRWTLLVVRELLIRGQSRYTDLRNGLPGIATNLLAERLRELEEAGIVRREILPAPAAATVYELTPRGTELEPVVHEIGRWGGPLLSRKRTGDIFQTHWLALPARLHLRDRTPAAPPIQIELRTGDEPLTIEAGGGSIRTRPGAADDPDAVISGTPQQIIAVLTGRLDLATAEDAGLRYEGDAEVLRRVQPPPRPAESPAR